MTSKKKPEPPLIDERHDRLVETPGDKETPVEDDVEQADDDLNDDNENHDHDEVDHAA